MCPQLDIRDPEAVKVAVDKIEQELGIPSVVRMLITSTKITVLML